MRWVFRAIFAIIIAAIIFMHLTTDAISDDSRSFWAVAFSGLGMAVFVVLLDILTPKKKLRALAGVFFG
ncbi:MAG: hypothetical protein ACYS29_18310, partial [Planctomycetota bacterium]